MTTPYRIALSNAGWTVYDGDTPILVGVREKTAFSLVARLNRLERYEDGMDLRRLIHMAGWESITQFCLDAEISKSVLSRVLKGHTRGGHEMIAKVAATLDMPGFETVPAIRKLTKRGGV